MTAGDPVAELTLRQRYLAAAEEIENVYGETSGQIGYDGRKRVRAAYQDLQELGSHIPDEPPGSPLRWGGMDDKAIARAVRHAEQGLAGPAAVQQLVHELRAVRSELRALGGPYGVTDEDIRSVVAQGFHTALRKSADSMDAAIAWKAIRDMDASEYTEVCRAVSGQVIAMLRDAEARAAEQAEGTP